MTTAKPTTLSKVKTGIAELDEICKGGLPKNRSTLIAGTSGSAKTIIALQFLVNGIEMYKEPGVFVTFEETPKDIQYNVSSLGWDLKKYIKAKKFAFVDVSPEPIAHQIESDEYDFSALIARIKFAINKVGAKRICIDSIGSLFAQFNNANIVRRELFRLVSALKLLNVTSIITLERLQEYGEIGRFGVEEFVSDNVIILRNVLASTQRHRTIEILKFRGAPHQKGEYPFTVSDIGVSVLPLSSMKLNQAARNIRISIGNETLDAMYNGGIFRDSIVLVSGATGTGKTLIATTFANASCKQKEKVLFLAFEESRSQLLRNAMNWAMDLNKYEKRGLLKIVCAYPEHRGLEDHLLNIKREIEEFKPDRIVLDSLSAIERVAGSDRNFQEFTIGLTSFLKFKQITTLFTATTNTLTGGTSVIGGHISTMIDTIMLLKYVEIMGQLLRGITILKMRGSAHDKNINQYVITDDGIHILGPFANIGGGIMSGLPTQAVTSFNQVITDSAHIK